MPTINDGSKHFQAVTYTGNGSTNTITGLNFQPDFVWIKGRSGATDHAIYDAVRGTTLDLASNTTAAETTQSTGLTAFNSNGFTLGALSKVNTNNATYVAWCWKANGTGVSNTSGSITSTVSANTSAGFSVVTYTGTGATGTVGHGLGVAPSMVIVKQRTASSATSWYIYHASIGATYSVYFNSTSGQDGPNAVFWNNTAPTSSVFSIGTSTGVSATSGTFVAYCWTPIAGYSSFGSYTGNGSSTGDGPMVYLGFRPRFIMIKASSTGGAGYGWWMLDTTRSSYNQSAGLSVLGANLPDIESSGWKIDVLSNGFKIRDTLTSLGLNATGVTYVYACFASNPFKTSRAF